MTFRKLKNKLIFCSHGVYFALTIDEVNEIRDLLATIETGKEISIFDERHAWRT